MTLKDHNNAKKRLIQIYEYRKKHCKETDDFMPFFMTLNNDFFNKIKSVLLTYVYGQKIQIIRPGYSEIIWFVCQCLIDYGFEIEKFWNDIYVETDFSIYDKDYNDEFNELIYIYRKNVQKCEHDMKFDKIIMNPPYSGNSNLYGKITLVAKKHSKEVICLSPYLNYLETVQKQSVKDVANQLLPDLFSYELAKNNGFDASFDKDLCIFHFKDNVEHPVDINEIYWNQFSNPILTKSIIDKVKAYGNYCYDKIISKKDFDKYEFKVAFTGVRGHCINGIKQWDWTTILDEDKMNNFNYSSNKKEDLMGIPFSNELQCKSFVDFANSDIFGYLILIQKHSINMDKWLFKLIPYLDFSKNWSEEELCKELKFTDEEDDYIKEEMKNYGWKTRK